MIEYVPSGHTREGCGSAELTEFSVGAGAYFTLFISKPNEALENLPLYPEVIASYDGCAGCFEFREGQDPVMCDKVRMILQTTSIPRRAS